MDLSNKNKVPKRDHHQENLVKDPEVEAQEDLVHRGLHNLNPKALKDRFLRGQPDLDPRLALKKEVLLKNPETQ